MPIQALETEQKALEINLDDTIYGTLAEIGAGQEVARHFFQVGAAAGTIAKTMSAYDKVFSDHIYGTEESGRYVCESRLYKMLDHEYELMEYRLGRERPDTSFFVFADTVSAINYQKTIKGHGWMGMRFQLEPQGEVNEIVLHVNMKDQDNRLQQQAVGILGVNLIYACFHYHHDAELLLRSLMDNLKNRVEIDMVRITGPHPHFANLDNRWLCLMLVKHQMTDVAMFGPDSRNLHPSEFLYKKNVLLVRGSFRPATLVNEDMIKKSWEQFKMDSKEDVDRCYQIAELTFNNLCAEGTLNIQDFLDRVDILCEMGQTVAITNCEEHYKMINYLSQFKIKKLGLVLGVKEILTMISQRFYENQDGRLLAAFGELFTRNVKLYAYPALLDGEEVIMNTQNMPVPEGVKFLYKHLLDSHQIVDIEGVKHSLLHIYSKDILQQIKDKETGWEQFVPEIVARLIQEKELFTREYQSVTEIRRVGDRFNTD